MKLELKEVSTVELLREIMSRERIAPTPSRREFASPHVEAIVGIGKDHYATVTVDEDALAVLFEKSKQLSYGAESCAKYDDEMRKGELEKA